jgi:hypothetical protein
MRFKKYFHTLYESKNFSVAEYASQLKSAYKAIFNLDDDDFLDVKIKSLSNVPSTHNILSVDIEFLYNEKYYKILNSTFHYKIPKDRLRALSDDERDKFEDTMKSIPYEPLTEDMIKNPHVQVEHQCKIFQMTEGEDRFGVGEMIFVDARKVHTSLGEYVQMVKNIIDNS